MGFKPFEGSGNAKVCTVIYIVTHNYIKAITIMHEAACLHTHTHTGVKHKVFCDTSTCRTDLTVYNIAAIYINCIYRHLMYVAAIV